MYEVFIPFLRITQFDWTMKHIIIISCKMLAFDEASNSDIIIVRQKLRPLTTTTSATYC